MAPIDAMGMEEKPPEEPLSQLKEDASEEVWPPLKELYDMHQYPLEYGYMDFNSPMENQREMNEEEMEDPQQHPKEQNP